jgi:hypothetical protein
MIDSLVLDALLVLILALLVPIGVYRGGIREGFTSAGLLLGVALSAEWAVKWGDWVADNSRLAEGATRFLISISLLAVTTISIGYGSAAAFAYRPGPGGRLYGAILAATNGVVFLSYVFDYVITFLYDGERPALITESYLARTLALGTGLILLICVGLVALATAFGFIAREKAEDEIMGVDSPELHARGQWRRVNRRRAGATAHGVDKVEPKELPGARSEPVGGPLVEPTLPVYIREVRHWEREPASAPGADLPTSGWSRTWPAGSVNEDVQLPWSRPSPRPAKNARSHVGQARSRPNQTSPGSEVLQDWLRSDSGSTHGRSTNEEGQVRKSRDGSNED